MSITQLIADYGYLAVFVGSLLEGETVLLLAGFAAQQGHLAVDAVLSLAFVGGTLGDQVFFWLGRRVDRSTLDRIRPFRQHATRISELLRRHDAPLIVGIRFMYGLRIVGPIAMGAAGVSPRRFALFNVLGAAVWALLIGGAGYVFGQSVELVLGDVSRYKEVALVAVAAVALVLSGIRAWLKSRST